MAQVGKVHIVGAGIAGLAAAVRCAEMGLSVWLDEAAGQAGGRCRSFVDAEIGGLIDNGNHLILGANPSLFGYLAAIGARGALSPLDPIRFPFFDLATGTSWSLRPGLGRFPWWAFVPGRTIPGAGLADYAEIWRVSRSGPGTRLGDLIRCDGPFYERFWEPFVLAVLNTEVAEASAHLVASVLAQTLLKGGAASRPYFAPDGLGAALVDPALAYLAAAGVEVAFSRRLRGLEFADGRVSRLQFGDEARDIAPDDTVILAVPSWEAEAMVPGLVVPRETRPIVNAHFRLDGAFELVGGAPFLALLGGTAQWLFRRGESVSATVSAAVALADAPGPRIAELIWQDVSRAIGRTDAPLPPNRIIKERRATIAQTPEEIARRPEARTAWPNLVLAGDWTATGLPATLEGAARSGEFAAELAARTPVSRSQS